MTTGILCATPEEFDALHHRFEFDEEPTTLAGFEFWKGYVPDRAQPLVLAQSGIGKVNAATLATILFTTFGCDDLIFSGVAGALTDLEVGSVVLISRGATHDYGLVSNGVFTCVPVGDLPLPGIAQPLQELPRVPAQVEQNLEHLRDRMADKLTIRLGSVCQETCLSIARMPEPASKPLAVTSWIWSPQRSSKSPTVSIREPTSSAPSRMGQGTTAISLILRWWPWSPIIRRFASRICSGSCPDW